MRGFGVAAAAVSATVAGCGSRQDVQEPSANFPVQIVTASFPSSQQVTQKTAMVLTIRNAGTREIPNLAVTICNVTCASHAPPGEGTSAHAFMEWLTAGPSQSNPNNAGQPPMADPSKPVWIIDRPPGPCLFSCQNGDRGSRVTAYSNTWAMGGQLQPGATAEFKWQLTPVKPGTHVVAYQIAAGLNGKAKAVLEDGGAPQGTFHVDITNPPAQSYVNNSGQIVSTH